MDLKICWGFSGLETTLLWGHKNLLSKLTGVIPDAKIQICLLGLPASARSPNLEKTFEVEMNNANMYKYNKPNDPTYRHESQPDI